MGELKPALFPARESVISAACLAFFLLIATQTHALSILQSKHNLSATGPGTIKASTEKDVCIFCHAAHGNQPQTPLWNRNLSTVTYTTYNSTTVKASIGQPTGASKLCLSCHDGTIALGMLRSRTNQVAFKDGVTTLPSGPTRLGTDLSDDHPVSFVYDNALAAADGELKDPATLVGRVKLDHNHEMQCTSCHDPHDDQFGKFLVQNNTGSLLCLNCHTKNYWESSSHSTSGAVWNGQGTNPWHTTATTVQANGCDNCHSSHNAGTKPRLLNFAGEEQNCYVCHNGNVAAANVQSEFNKMSTHPIEATAGVHDPTEDTVNPPRHVECADCHNPHAANATTATAPNASGALAGVKGIDAMGAIVKPVQKEYELCFRCHADSTARGPARVNRQIPETNTRLQFAIGNQSFHPLEATGKSANVPSLIAPLTVSSRMGCIDCHNNDQGPGAGGLGPKGPHGSAYTPILERMQVLNDFSGESPATYALCYKCHSRSSILSDQSFPHSRHVVNDQTACTTCHDPHGVASAPHLINFNIDYVKPFVTNSVSTLNYTPTGNFHGNCTMTCHGKDHNNTAY